MKKAASGILRDRARTTNNVQPTENKETVNEVFPEVDELVKVLKQKTEVNGIERPQSDFLVFGE